MIITANKALKIVSSHDVVRAVPELLEAVEACAVAQRSFKAKAGCGNCSQIDHFSQVEIQALEAIGSLPPDAVGRLKAFLGDKKLYINPVESGKDAKLKELKG